MRDSENACRISLPRDLLEARFVLRRNRFAAEISLDGIPELAHVPSSGRMSELLYPGARIYVSPQHRPGVKLKYRILLAEDHGHPVSVDSLLPNRLIHRALVGGFLPDLPAGGVVKKEAAYGRGRFDFYLQESEGPGCYLEVKSVTLVEGGVALFPDAPSERGARHLEELAAARREGCRAVVMFVIQRADALCFKPHRHRDPRFGQELSRAARAGVEVMALDCRVSLREVALKGVIPVCI